MVVEYRVGQIPGRSLLEGEAFPKVTRHWSCSKNKFDFLFWTTSFSIPVGAALAGDRVPDLDEILLPVSSCPKNLEMEERVTSAVAEDGTIWAPPNSASEEPCVRNLYSLPVRQGSASVAEFVGDSQIFPRVARMSAQEGCKLILAY